MNADKRATGLLLALLVVLLSLWVSTMAYGGGWELFCGPDRGTCEMGGCQPCQPVWPGSAAGIAIWVGGVALLAGGVWWAWRLGSGHWGLRRRARSQVPDQTPEPASRRQP